MHVVPETHVSFPVRSSPAHCEYLGSLPPELELPDVVATLLVEVFAVVAPTFELVPAVELHDVETL